MISYEITQCRTNRARVLVKIPINPNQIREKHGQFVADLAEKGSPKTLKWKARGPDEGSLTTRATGSSLQGRRTRVRDRINLAGIDQRGTVVGGPAITYMGSRPGWRWGGRCARGCGSSGGAASCPDSPATTPSPRSLACFRLPARAGEVSGGDCGGDLAGLCATRLGWSRRRVGNG